MSDPTPELITVAAVMTAAVRGRVPPDELRTFFDDSFSALSATLEAQGIRPTGPAFGLYRDAPEDIVDLEVGFPTDREVTQDGDVIPSSLPKGSVARVVHRGSFDELDASWQQLRSWAQEQALTLQPLWWEVYVTEPSPDMDPRDLRTELNAPLED
jgi:effector-binding domain-containing protein